MSDLDAFFSKKDKRKDLKKKGVSTTGTSGGRVSGSGGGGDRSSSERIGNRGDLTSVIAQENAAIKTQTVPSEGWVDFEETRRAQVHTGGKTIVELRRDEMSSRDGGAGDRDGGSERFSGWKVQTEEVEEEKPQATLKDKFPSLADAAKAPKQTAASSTKRPEPQRYVRRFANFSSLVQEVDADKVHLRKEASEQKAGKPDAAPEKPAEPPRGPNRFESLKSYLAEDIKKEATTK